MATTDNNAWIQEQNAEVKRWSSMVTRKLKTSASRFQHGKSGMVMRHTPSQHQEDKLKHNLNAKIYKNDGLADGVGIKIERHGVFVQKGVGRGYITSGGFVTRGKKTNKDVQLYAKAQNRAVASKKVTSGGMNRSPVDWFNSIIEASMPELIEKITNINADAVVNQAKIIIK